MPKPVPTYILTLSCHDKAGIVAAVSGLLAQQGGFIIESAQFGDPSTQRFFMRTVFSLKKDREAFRRAFAAVAKKFNMEWQLHAMTTRPRVLIMVSKAAHCLQDLLYRWRAGLLPIDICAIVSNHTTLKSVAKTADIPFHHLPVTEKTKAAQEKKLLSLIKKDKVDVVVLARYMQVLSPQLCNALYGRIINIHHSFLPGFKGANPYQQAYDRGVKIIGATAHYATPDLDEGPIIEQETLRVDHSHSPEALKQLGQDCERQVLARALTYHIEQRVLLNDGKTVVFR